MKKIIILTSLFLLVGAGCTGLVKKNAETNDSAQEEAVKPNLSKQEISELDQLFSVKDEESGLKTHHPTYIPEEIKLNKESVLISDSEAIGKVLTYHIGAEPGSDAPWILVQEQANSPENGTRVPSENEVDISGLNGYGITSKNEAGTFYHVVFTTEDNTFIKLTSKYFDINTLAKIAKSMK
ncbi:MAG: hypothetical protein Q8O88_05395 [bacterium]|nr:hypothetical protein [bacterium]